MMIPKAIETDAEEPEVVVRLTRSRWGDKRGVHEKTSLVFLHRKCKGFNWIEEDISAIGGDEFLRSVVNLHQCPDGIYTIGVNSSWRDWETGILEVDDYKLTPYREPENVA